MHTKPIAVFLFSSCVLTACPKGADEGSKETTNTPQSSAPTSQPAQQPSQNVAEGQPFRGTIRLGEGLKPEDVQATDVLFVMARESQGGPPGRLLAVRRFDKLQLPLEYQLSSQDMMVPGVPFTGPFSVTARLDRDGDPMTRGEDDLYATYEGSVATGADKIDLVLKKGQAASPQPQQPASQPGK